MTTITDTTPAIGPAVSIEPSATPDLPYNLLLTGRLGKADTELASARTMTECFKSTLVGCGNVDLHSLIIKIQMTGDKQSAVVGVASANATFTADTVASFPGAFIHSSNAYNYGQLHVYNVIVPSLYSKQVQPASSLHMPFKLGVFASKGVNIYYEARLKHHGPRVVVADLSSF